MIQINLSVNEQAVLRALHQKHIHPVIRQRAQVILLRSEKISNTKISSITGLGETTIIDYAHQYLTKGESWVTTLKFKKPESKLQPFDQTIKEHFDNNPVSTISQACQEILELTGVVIFRSALHCRAIRNLICAVDF